jgi:predicted DNA-binding transcriptional regulator YafY
MGKIHDRHKRYRERLLRIIVFLLQNPGSHSIQEMVKRFNVSDKTLRGDFRYLEEIFNANGRQYIIRKHGRIEANFSRAVANLNPEVRLYFFLALKQVEPILRGEGERAYKELLQHAYAVLPKEDVERLKDWDKFYFISQYGYPLHRSHFYKTLTEVLDAIRFHQILKFTFSVRRN